MEVKIGVQNISKEISLESDMGLEELEKVVSQALQDKTVDGVLKLVGVRGNTILVPTKTIAYVEICASGKRHIGFGAV